MSILDPLRIVQYTPEHYEAVKGLFHRGVPEERAPDYFYFTRELFEWLYKGFGHNHFTSLLLYKDDELVGFRGAQPGFYQVPLKDGSYVVEKGNGLTGWEIREDVPEIKGMGLRLHMQIQESLPVAVACFFGRNVSLPAFKVSRFTILEALHRYVLPLDPYGYIELLPEKVALGAVEAWVRDIDQRLQGISPSVPQSLSAEVLEALWKRISAQAPIFSVHKTIEYWQWRYIDSPAYRYLIWGDPEGAGVVIGRIGRIFVRKCHQYDDSHPLHGKKVLRLIEVLPSSRRTWEGGFDPSFRELVGPVLKWSQEEGCLAADFQCSTDRLANALFEIGFKEQGADYRPAICGLAGLFQPFRYKPAPINAAWRVKLEDYPGLSLDARDTYIVKSDVAGDYPKFWPMPEGWR